MCVLTVVRAKTWPSPNRIELMQSYCMLNRPEALQGPHFQHRWIFLLHDMHEERGLAMGHV